MHLFPKGKKYVYSIAFCCMIGMSYGQHNSTSWLKPKKIGLLFNKTNEQNFLFDDPDYFYKSTLVKGQLFYTLFDWNKTSLHLIVQPQYQRIKHQLLNPSFVGPEVTDYLIKRERFTRLKEMNLYAIEFGISIYKPLFNRVSAEITVGLGFAYIDTETERLAEGFTFIENGSIGFSYETSNRTSVYIGSNIGHVSNFDFKQPNDGYNVVGYEIGFRYRL